MAVCGVPENATTDCGGPGVFVKLNTADVATPDTEAVTLYAPATLFAAGTGDVAIPELFVLTVTEFVAPNVAPAPAEGLANVTAIPVSGFENASVTFA